MKRKNKSGLFLALTLAVMLFLLIIVLFARKHSEPAQLPHDNDQPVTARIGENATSTGVLESNVSKNDQKQSETVQPTPLLSKDGPASSEDNSYSDNSAKDRQKDEELYVFDDNMDDYLIDYDPVDKEDDTTERY